MNHYVPCALNSPLYLKTYDVVEMDQILDILAYMSHKQSFKLKEKQKGHVGYLAQDTSHLAT